MCNDYCLLSQKHEDPYTDRRAEAEEESGVWKRGMMSGEVNPGNIRRALTIKDHQIGETRKKKNWKQTLAIKSLP